MLFAALAGILLLGVVAPARLGGALRFGLLALLQIRRMPCVVALLLLRALACQLVSGLRVAALGGAHGRRPCTRLFALPLVLLALLNGAPAIGRLFVALVVVKLPLLTAQLVLGRARLDAHSAQAVVHGKLLIAGLFVLAALRPQGLALGLNLGTPSLTLLLRSL